MKNIVIEKSDLRRDFEAAIYLSEASPPRFLSWGSQAILKVLIPGQT